MKCEESFDERFVDHCKRKIANYEYNLKYQNPSESSKIRLEAGIRKLTGILSDYGTSLWE